MNRRQLFPAALSLISVIGWDWLHSRPTLAGLFDFLNSDSPRRSATPTYDFQEVYENSLHLTRAQLTKLQSGNIYYWSDLASKPYGRLQSSDGLEHYFFKFGFGEGGVIVISDSNGIVQNWELVGQAIAPEYNPPDMSDYVYQPPSPEPTYSPPHEC